MGPAEFNDDLTITDDAALWRRIPSWHFVYDENLGRMRPSSAAFDNDGDDHPMSIVLAELVLVSGRNHTEILAGHIGFALAQFTAGLARSKQQGVQRDPLSDEPAHALVFGKKSGSVKRAFANASQWIVPPLEKPAGLPS